MNKITRLGLCGALALASATCVLAADEQTIATINGEKITAQDQQRYAMARQSNGQGMPPQMVTEELINRLLIVQDAQKRGLDKDPDYTTVLKDQQANLLAAFAINHVIESEGPITEALLKKEYDAYVGTLTDQEYQARHILLENEADAQAVIKELDKGENFAALAEQKSTGPSASEGGDLGWFRAEQMVGPFAEAVKALKVGAYSQQPVQTQFGWHVILLEDSRQLPPPSFDSLREQLQGKLVNQRVEDYIQSLRNKAEIRYN